MEKFGTLILNVVHLSVIGYKSVNEGKKRQEEQEN